MGKSNNSLLSSKIKDITGQKFGMLFVMKFYGLRSRRAYWLCQCNCGNQSVVEGKKLRSGHTKSCGCLKRLNGPTTHGHSANGRISSEYSSWVHMIRRCYDSNSDRYRWYGGKGIAVHERYHDFRNFFTDLGPKPSAKHSLDRVDNNKGYEPGNLRWATAKQQLRNSSRTIRLIFCGETKPLCDWADILGIKPGTIRCRIYQYGWSVERALSTPVCSRRATL